MPIRKRAHYKIRSHALKVPSQPVRGRLASYGIPANRRFARRLDGQEGTMKLKPLRFASSKSFRSTLSLPARLSVTEHPSQEAEASAISLSGLQVWLSFGMYSIQKPALGEIHVSDL